MANYSDWTTAANAVAHPSTTPDDLLQIAQAQPSLMAQVAAHPHAHPDLLTWLDSFQIPEVSAVVAARRGQQQPPVPVRKVKPWLIVLIAVLAVALVSVMFFATRSIPKPTPSTMPASQTTASSDPTTVSPATPIVPGISVYGGTGSEWFSGSAVTADNDIIQVGMTESSDGDFPWTGSGKKGALAVKTSPDGSLIWAKTFGNENNSEFYAVALTDDGGMIIVGYTGSTTGDITTHTTANGALVVKLDSEGTLIWAHTYGGDKPADSGTGGSQFTKVTVTSEGHIIVVGFTSSVGGDFPVPHGDNDALIAKLDSDGTLLWWKRYGGSARDYFDSVAVNVDGSIVLVGRTGSEDGDFPAAHSTQNALIVKLTSQGTIEWVTTYGGSKYDSFHDVTLAADGTITAVGVLNSLDGHFELDEEQKQEAILVQFSPDGTLLWFKLYGGTRVEAFGGVITANDGSLIVIGTVNSTDGNLPPDRYQRGSGVVVSFTPTGDINWARAFCGRDYPSTFSAVAVAADGSVIISGTTFAEKGDITISHGGTSDATVVRLTPTGDTEG